jgi:hypothetical protein
MAEQAGEQITTVRASHFSLISPLRQVTDLTSTSMHAIG